MKTPSNNVPTVRTRREFLKTTGLLTASVAAVTLPSQSGLAQQRIAPGSSAIGDKSQQSQSPPSGTNFEKWKDRKVAQLASRPQVAFSPAQAERHTIYSLSLMAITFSYWNGNKYGRGCQYPLNEPVPAPTCVVKTADDYIGHNIAALIVDANGYIIDFDFNHNEIFNSSVEHAESRLLRRVFSLTQIHDSWDLGRKAQDQYYATELKSASLYTTLESCAQCSGIMALAQLKEVIFLQTDPGEYFRRKYYAKYDRGNGFTVTCAYTSQMVRASSFCVAGFCLRRLPN